MLSMEKNGSVLLPRPLTALLILVFFFLAVFMVFGSSLGNKFVSWDDQSLIVDNPVVNEVNFKTIGKAFTSYDPELYIPLTFVSYQIDHLIGGENPLVFHLHNLVLHTLNSVLVAWFVWILLGNGYIALACGLLFALHPLNVEAAVWASARKDVLSTFFFLASILFYLFWREKRRNWIFMASLFLFFLGLLAKVSVIMLPLVLLLIDAYFEENKLTLRAVTGKIPFFVLSVVFGIVALSGKQENLVKSTMFEKIIMATRSTVFYPLKFVMPSGLSPLYPFTGTITLSSPEFYLPFVIVILCLVLALFLWHRAREISFGILFYFLTLIPSFFNYLKGGNVYIASDRYAYIPIIGFIFLLGTVVYRLLSSAGTVRVLNRRRLVLSATCIVVLISAGIASAGQAAVWENSETLYRHVIEYYPNARGAHNNLGMELYLSDRFPEAISEFKIALDIQPDPRIMVNLADAYFHSGLTDEAFSEYSLAVKLGPDLPDGYYGIGNIYAKQGKLPDAVAQYQKALEINPKFINALNNLGGVYIQLKQWDNAIDTLERTVALKPDFVEAYYNLAGAYQQKGIRDRAEFYYTQALKLKPDDADALANLASLLYQEKRIDEAAKLLKRAFEIQENNPVAISLLMKMKKDGIVK